MHKSPIFISGIGRSGTSAVISALAEHKQVIRPDRVGEAPIVQHFLRFLCEFEDHSPEREYHLNNYQLEASERARLFSSTISTLQYGVDVSEAPDEQQFWVAKVSLSEDTFNKALDVFGGLRIIYVMRNGVEVVNSARHFPGFANLTFEQLCRRWSESIVELSYLMSKSNCAVIRHEELVNNPQVVFEHVYARLDMQSDVSPAEFVKSTLFNSSFNPMTRMHNGGQVFNNRLACWSQWSASEKSTFIDCCDEYMQALEFQRPYESGELPAITAEGQPAASQPMAISGDDPKRVSPPGDNTGFIKAFSNGLMSCELLDYHCHVSLRHDYLHIENPMVAESSTLPVLQLQENHLFASKMDNPFARNQSPMSRLSALDENRQKHFLCSDDVYRFAFVRNPFERLLAAWLLKIDRPLQPKAEILAVINGVEVGEITDLSQPVDFASFVDVVCSMEPLSMSPHWSHQSRLLLLPLIQYSKIGRYENISSDFAEICQQIFPEKSAGKLHSDKSQIPLDVLLNHYDDSLAARVYQAYYDDFNAFEYPEKLPALARSA